MNIIPEIKNIALVAHDNKKKDLMEWAAFNKESLCKPVQTSSVCHRHYGHAAAAAVGLPRALL